MGRLGERWGKGWGLGVWGGNLVVEKRIGVGIVEKFLGRVKIFSVLICWFLSQCISLPRYYKSLKSFGFLGFKYPTTSPD
jgi:hypothetical protein